MAAVTAPAPTVTAPAPVARVLNALDLCDTRDCTARAYWLVAFPSGNELQFCVHHGRKAELGVLEAGGIIDQQVDDLT